MNEIVSGLRFPEGPIAMPDGSVVLVEIERQTLSRVTPEGSIEVIAKLGGGPNGAAMGPDGAVYVCNNGGFKWSEEGGLLAPAGTPDDYSGGRIERVDLATGEFDVVYRECDGRPLNGPNDIVFDAQGGMWFTDLGKTYETYRDVGCIYYAKPDGSLISRQLGGRESPNGIGLSPDEKTLYFAETMVGRVWAYDITAPGQLDPRSGRLVVGLPGMQLFDSLAIDAEGNVCVATLVNGGITIVSPDGERVEHVATGDVFTTNICFGGEDLKTAYITLSGTGRLVRTDWPVAGLPLNFLNR
ncbi:MAG: gluconolaconase [Gammaproteobacteria bacterium]|nr:gluconolaconase [Gammaproteobacteria bacterium]